MKIKIKNKHIGKMFEYYTHSGKRREAKCTGIEFCDHLRKPVFIGISPYGNPVRLSKSEIESFY